MGTLTRVFSMEVFAHLNVYAEKGQGEFPDNFVSHQMFSWEKTGCHLLGKEGTDIKVCL